MAANSGLDPEGHQEEVFLLATAMLHFYERMMPRRHSSPAAHLDSSKKLIQSVARTHLVRGIKMVSLEVVSLACKAKARLCVQGCTLEEGGVAAAVLTAARVVSATPGP